MKVRTEARRDAILETASAVFLEKGFERASMSEIAQRVGGSKATLYGYFPSKEELFVAVTLAEGERHVHTAMTELNAQGKGGLRPALTRFCEVLLNFLASDSVCATHRMVVAEAGRSDIGQQFFEAGPQKGLTGTAEVLAAAMERGELRQADPKIAAQHLLALVTSEAQQRWFFRSNPPLTKAEARRMVERAVDVFLRGYAP